ncbi:MULTISPECIES: ethanolamine permease [unclassified Pseudovibrio]|uniref:ethanolamine permease n=1 Tax=unclassified Pseudovibrio TaxID=2627060 RepID=UPI0007B21DA9|nr:MULTISPECIES: ethanolamine permease [unclassified Pseudovibrio]KZK98795.1 putative amino acid permease YhdG [Pseudovibrio sp. W74]KZL09288.1 putative amino acid permease YhdG [Pseudovibrio sp. Ad14]
MAYSRLSIRSWASIAMKHEEKSQLQKGAAGWFLLATLGVSYVISGSFAGWNYGFAVTNWFGMVIAVALMGLMYFCLVLCLAEMSAALPSAAGGYRISRKVMGDTGGFATALAVLLEYSIATAAIVIFIGQYLEALWGINGPLVYAVFYVVFIGVHLLGAGEALRFMLVVTAFAVLAIVVTLMALVPHFSFANLAASVHFSSDQQNLLAFDEVSIWAALPFAMWLFLAVEGVPLAAEEAKNPAVDLPRGIIGAMLFLLANGLLIVVFIPGAATAVEVGDYGAPLVDALDHVFGEDSVLASIVNLIGLTGLIASFFSIIFGYSRLVFAMSREGYLPRFMSAISSRKVPHWALIIPGVIGFLCSLTGKGELMINIAVIGATLSYALQSVSYILLKRDYAELHRPYRAPGGQKTAYVTLALSLLALTSCFAYDLVAALIALALMGLGVGYYVLLGRRRA